jgi:hypothetical protein
MIKKDKAIIAFLAGASGGLFLIIFSSLIEMPMPEPDNLLTLILFFIVVVGFVEEGIKFLLVSRWGEFPYYCIFLGLGYAFFEMLFRDIIIVIGMRGLSGLLDFTFWFRHSLGFVLQIISTVALAYFIKQNRPVFGLISMTLLHGFMDVLLFI